jgi:hypothetical protein
LADINEYIYRNIVYASEEGDYCQSPIETLERGKGDCEDFAILFAYLAYESLGMKSEIVVVNTGEGVHSLVFAEGKYYEPTLGIVDAELFELYTIMYTFSYDITMLYATGFYTKGI